LPVLEDSLAENEQVAELATSPTPPTKATGKPRIISGGRMTDEQLELWTTFCAACGAEVAVADAHNNDGEFICTPQRPKRQALAARLPFDILVVAADDS
jgi:hypothetical protein